MGMAIDYPYFPRESILFDNKNDIFYFLLPIDFIIFLVITILKFYLILFFQ